MQQQRSGIRRWFDLGDPVILPQQQPAAPLDGTHHNFALGLPCLRIEITTDDVGAVDASGQQGRFMELHVDLPASPLETPHVVGSII